ncbi:MAG: hypothetical protein U1A27_01400 [Phycisphaerae bacterium]
MQTRALTFGLYIALAALLVAGFASTPAAAQTATDLQSILDQLGGTTGTSTTGTTTGTTTTPTDTGTGTGTTTGGSTGSGTSPTRGGLNNVTLGALASGSPGAMIQRGIGLHTGSVTIPGDADQFVKPNVFSQALFQGTQSVLQSLQSSLQSLVQTLLLGLGLGGSSLFGPGTINVGQPIANAVTTGTGDVVMLP